MVIVDFDTMTRLDRAEQDAERRWREAMKGTETAVMRAAARAYTAAATEANRYALALNSYQRRAEAVRRLARGRPRRARAA